MKIWKSDEMMGKGANYGHAEGLLSSSEGPAVIGNMH